MQVNYIKIMGYVFIDTSVCLFLDPLNYVCRQKTIVPVVTMLKYNNKKLSHSEEIFIKVLYQSKVLLRIERIEH